MRERQKLIRKLRKAAAGGGGPGAGEEGVPRIKGPLSP